MSKGAKLRLEKKLKEAEEHKKRMAALKATKTNKNGASTQVQKKFDRTKLNAGFMNNAKASKDEVQGWALDFENPNQQALISEERQLQQALKNSMEDCKQQSSAVKKSEEEVQIQNVEKRVDGPKLSIKEIEEQI